MIKSFLRFMLQNAVFANILMLLIVFAGIISATRMVREIFPSFSFDVVTISVPYPGADPAEVEEGVCLKLEEALEGIEGVREISTTAMEGIGTASVECEDGADVQEVKDEVSARVEAVVTFPGDAEKPIVREAKARSDVLGIAVWGELPEDQLKEIAENLKDELLTVDGISQLSVSGIRDYEIAIEISEEKLRQLGLTLSDVRTAVARMSLNVPGGSIRTAREEIRIRTMGRCYTAREYAGIPVVSRADGTVLRLGQIASVKDSFAEDISIQALFNGEPAVSVDVYKTAEEDSLRISAAVDKFLERKRNQLPPSVHLTKWRDTSRFISGRLGMLLRNGRIGLVLVFLSLWCFLDLRLSFWVAMGIPISLAGGLALMGATGETINMLSLFGLIMVLGLIVDDAIVVGEAIYVHRRSGDDSFTAAAEGAAEVALPVVAAVTTTIVAFMPLFFVSGVMGKFIGHIPAPVVAALAVSLVEALIILPVHLRHLPALKPRSARGFFRFPRRIRRTISAGLERFVTNVYGPCIDRVLEWRYAALALALTVLFVTVGLVKGGVIKFVFFPEADDDFIVANIELPSGTPIAETRAVAAQVIKGWRLAEAQTPVAGNKDLSVAIYALVGGRAGRTVESGNHLVQVYVELLPSEERKIHYRALAQAWQKRTGRIANAVSTEFGAMRHGPGGRPLDIMLLGRDNEALLAAAGELAQKLESLEGVYDVQLDYRPGKREFRVQLRPEAYSLGLTVAALAAQLREGFYGGEAVRVQRGRDDIKVKLRYPLQGGRDSIEHFERIHVRTPRGVRVPLSSVASVTMEQGYTTIRRKDRKRTISVSGDVNRRLANAEEIMRHLEESFLPELMRRYPTLSRSTKGQAEARRESLESLRIGFPLALVGVYLIIATIFRSYIQPVVIMLTIPFGLVGAVYGHVLFRMPLTMMSFFGMVALTGIVVNDSIVLIEAVNRRLEQGLPFLAALREGGKRRFRAIFLTTLTTFAGLMPIIVEKSLQAQFLIPMAIAIAFGVAFATVVTLIVIPCLLAVLNDARRVLWLTWFGAWPNARQVEPAAARGTDSSAVA